MTKPSLPPLILAPCDTGENAAAVCQAIEAAVREHFPARVVLRGYSARSAAREQRKGSAGSEILQPADLLRRLAAEGYRSAIVQSLNLLPGHEFHQLHNEVRHIDAISCRLGKPLFSSPEDYRLLLDLLAPRIQAEQDRAVLLVGHGTRHPVWTAYLALENLLQRRFGKRVMVGVIEHYPSLEEITERLLAVGSRKVLLLPFFLAAGLHVRRDVLGDAPGSWRSRLQRLGLEIEGLAEGLGTLPGLGELVIRHIEEADRQQETGEGG